MAKLMQYVGTILISSTWMCLGLIYGWASSTLHLFESANTTLHRPMNQVELGLLGSLPSIGALIATPLVGLTLDKIGRKNWTIITSLLSVLTWTMVACSTRVEVILVAMFVSGIGGIALLTVPVYISEICEESIRGAMTTATSISYGIGLLLSYLLGGILEYDAMIYVCLTVTIGSTVLIPFLKESPICLMVQNRQQEAAEALGFYRSLKNDAKEIHEELNTIKRSLNPEFDDIPSEEEKQLNPEKLTKEKIGFFKFIKRSRSTRAAFSMIIILETLTIFQGLAVILVYARPLFEKALPTLSPNTASILLALVAICAGFITAYLTEAAGRRPLLIYSSLAAAAVCLVLGVQIHLLWGPDWLIAVNIYIFTIVYTFGCGAVPYVLVAEIFLPEVRSVMTMIAMEWAWFCNFIILFIFNPLLKAIGLGPLFYLFATVSLVTGIFVIVYVPETKGLTVDAIQERFAKKKKSLKDAVY